MLKTNKMNVKNFFEIFFVFNLTLVTVTTLTLSLKAQEEGQVVAEEDDWTKQANFLSSKEGKVKEFRVKIENLIKKKHSEKSEDQRKQIIKEMTEAHREFTKATKDYNMLYNKLRYRFPDKTNKNKKRKYLPLREESIEQIENEMGLDADLTRIRKKINKKYSPYLEEELKAKQEAGPLFYKGKVKEDEDQKKRIRLEK